MLEPSESSPTSPSSVKAESTAATLSGRVILVVGGTSGIGEAVGRAARQAGAALVAVGPHASAIAEADRRWSAELVQTGSAQGGSAQLGLTEATSAAEPTSAGRAPDGEPPGKPSPRPPSDQRLVATQPQPWRSRARLMSSLVGAAESAEPNGDSAVRQAADDPWTWWLAGDAAEPETVARAVATAIRCFGRLDGLVHVAGGSGRRQGDGPLHEVTDAGWAWTLHQNLDAVAWSNRAAIQTWLQAGEAGSLINIGSVLARHPAPTHFQTHAYATAKAGIEGLSRSLAAAYARHSIRVNVLAPGLTETPMATRALQDSKIMQYVRQRQPLFGGRAVHATEIAAAAIYLLSPAASFVTGQVLQVDGGWSVSEGAEP